MSIKADTNNNDASFRNEGSNRQNISSQTPLIGQKSTIKVVRRQIRPTTAFGANQFRIPQKNQKLYTDINYSKSNLYQDPGNDQYNDYVKNHNPNRQSIDSFTKKHCTKFVAKRYSEQAYLDAVINENAST